MTRETFTFRLDKARLKEAELRDGHYLLRTNLVAEDPAVLWDRYVQLTQIEAAFKCLKSDLGIRPIHHQLEHRVLSGHLKTGQWRSPENRPMRKSQDKP